MSIRFKFRSSCTFESIDIGGQSSISIRDLKSEIVKKKRLSLCQDFDLIFSDSVSGKEYKDASVKIPCGSCVVIKRVPAASTSSLRTDDVSARCIGAKDSDHNDGNLLEVGKLQSDDNKKETSTTPRCADELLLRCHKLDATHPSQASPKDYNANEGSTLVMQSKPKNEEQMALERRTYHANHATESNNVPQEMKCSLCRNFFEEAVMIPCCQLSFCEKCICRALADNRKCPMCSSTKCKAGDLLPNFALRRAIKHFLQSETLVDGSENALYRSAPDGESGIQVELSCTATVNPKDPKSNHGATGKTSYHIMQSKLHDHTRPGDMLCKPGHGAFEDSSDFQGENDPQHMVPTEEEGCSTKREDGIHVIAGGKKCNSAAPGRKTLGQRTCYMCGSPDHLIRECPVAASSHTNHWNGEVPACAPPYWPGGATNFRPFVDMYGGSGMMYNTNMPPVTSFVYPSYVPSMYSFCPVPSGHMQPGLASMVQPTGFSVPQPRHMGFLHDHEAQQRNCNANLGRERKFHRVDNIGLQHDNMERRVNQINDRPATWSEGNHRSCNLTDNDTYSCEERQEKIWRQENGRGLRVSGSGRTTFEENMADSRIHDMEDRHEKHYRSSRPNDERGLYGSDPKQESIKRRRLEEDQRKPDKHHSLSRSSMDHSHSSGGMRQRREELSHRSRHSKKSLKSSDEYHHDREKSNKYPDGDY